MNRILVVGLGSMGKRRIRLLLEIDPDLQISGIDSNPDRRKEVQDLFGIPCYAEIRECVEKTSPEAGFVCTSPLSHRTIIMELLGFHLHVFTEINLVPDGYLEMMKLAEENGVNLFLSSTFLYRNDVRYMIKECNAREKLDYIIHTGQYLPDWHPWEDYKNYFVGNARTNGIREILAIDLPWILAAFGKVTDIHVRSSKSSSLEINYDDNYIISMEHENGSKGVFVCDLISRCAGRSAEIISEDLHLFWHGTPDSLQQYDIESKQLLQVNTYLEEIDHQVAYASNIIENAYKEEIRTFFGIVEGTVTAPYSMQDDLYTLEVINKIEGIQ